MAAELTVIVAGVLIALAADRWLLALDEAELEQEYLVRLATDLRRDSLNQATRAQHARDTYGRTQEVITAIRHGPEAVEHPGQFLTQLPWIFFLQYRAEYATETWDELGATGNLSLLRDSDLRRRLGEYYGTRLNSDIEEFWLRSRQAFSDVVRKALPPEMHVYSEIEFQKVVIGDSTRGYLGEDVVPDTSSVALELALENLAADPMAMPTLSAFLGSSIAQAKYYDSRVLLSVGMLRLVEARIADAS